MDTVVSLLEQSFVNVSIRLFVDEKRKNTGYPTANKCSTYSFKCIS